MSYRIIASVLIRSRARRGRWWAECECDKVFFQIKSGRWPRHTRTHETVESIVFAPRAGSRPEAEFEAEGLDDDSIPEAMDEERMIEAGRWQAGYAGCY